MQYSNWTQYGSWDQSALTCTSNESWRFEGATWDKQFLQGHIFPFGKIDQEVISFSFPDLLWHKLELWPRNVHGWTLRHSSFPFAFELLHAKLRPMQYVQHKDPGSLAAIADVSNGQRFRRTYGGLLREIRITSYLVNIPWGFKVFQPLVQDFSIVPDRSWRSAMCFWVSTVSPLLGLSILQL